MWSSLRHGFNEFFELLFGDFYWSSYLSEVACNVLSLFCASVLDACSVAVHTTFLELVIDRLQP